MPSPEGGGSLKGGLSEGVPLYLFYKNYNSLLTAQFYKIEWLYNYGYSMAGLNHILLLFVKWYLNTVFISSSFSLS